MQEIGHWINGKRVAGTSGRFADVMNPATGEVQARLRWPRWASWTTPFRRPPRPDPAGPTRTRSAAPG